ncbi:Extracellular ligand-binding receptor [Ferroglobus placidus DSM 10642]|uniref:Extracellular ligand-binding receptor n=1 Tax=Ferroglobus placidus (strain DSM 10642 / AEDII12DO) TaxID=589924 RepID=D3RXJ6_FERPA|nr:ABC transporter substrate-binding protein [Ferroglobus placidus]ADC65209.1 Extracellular ligand-binding receptor [Ferroglobus placidus DSM 10642]
MMRKVVLLLVVAALLFGCAQPAEKATPTPTPTPEKKETPAATPTPTPKFGGKKEVVIGVIGPMALPEGQAEEKAARLAAEEINAKGGILGLPIRIVVGDTKLNPDTAASEFRRLAEVEKADMILGGFSSGVMNTMMEVMAETKTVFLADASSPAHPAKVAENYEKYKYWFRISQNNGTTFAWDLAGMIDYLRSKGYEVNKVYIIRDEHVWTDAVMKDLTPLLEERGIEIVGDAKVGRGYTEYEQLLIDAEDKGADLVMPILAIAGTGDVLVKQWAELQPKFLLAGHDLAAIDYQFYEKTGGAAEYYIFLADGGVLVTAPPTEMAKHFIEAYKEKYGHYPESHQAYGAYDAVYIYKMAVEAAYKAGEENPFDPDVVVKYLEQFKPGNPAKLTRNVAFHKNHALVWGDEYVRNWVSQWQDGKQCILYPETVATCDLKLPPWLE